jgi:serine/threonine protein phosphatase 1
MESFLSMVKRLMGARQTPPRVPDGCCVYAIGDIHGRLDLLEPLVGRILSDAPDAANTLVFLGDYVDRGPSPKGVIDFLMALERPGWNIVKLRGNHEQVLLEYLGNPEIYQSWRTFGGAETLLSYGVRPPVFSDANELRRAHAEFVAVFSRSHLSFLNALSDSYVAGDYFFAHAGVRPGVPLDRQVSEDLLWVRDEFLSSDANFGKVVVHGHSPCEQPALRPNRICIDTGAYATGVLTAVKFLGDCCTFLSSNDK